MSQPEGPEPKDKSGEEVSLMLPPPEGPEPKEKTTACSNTKRKRKDSKKPMKKESPEKTAVEKKSMEKRSDAWDHFAPFIDEDGRSKAKCNYCGKIYCADSKKNGTTNLKGHLDNCKKYPHSIGTKQTQLSLQTTGEGSVSLKNWSFDQLYVRSKLIYMIVVDELPFKFVEGDGFVTFMEAAQPLFRIPSRWSISRDCYQLFLDEKKKLQIWFKKTGQSICITTDTWTSLQRINYMCITAHYVDDKWNLNKKILNFCSIDSHKGEQLGRAIDGCLRDWGIAKVFSVTVDNASSNDTCVAYLKAKLTARECVVAKGKYLHMRCIAHIVNLIVVDGLKEINPSIKKVREAVRWVRQSPSRLAKFRECCEDEGIGSKSLLCLDVTTRWNSTYLMLDVAQKFEMAFERFDLKDPYFKSELSDGVPTYMDWENVRRMVDILSIFYDLTMRISGSLYVTSNEFYHEISTVHCTLKEWIGSMDENVKAMGERMKSKYDKYWGDHQKMNKLIFIAVVLDPRYKLELIDYALCVEYGEEAGSRMARSIREALNELFEVYKPAQMQGQNSSRSSQESQQHHSIKKSRFLLGEKFKQHKIESGEVESKCDLDVYLKESVLVVEKDGFDILKWWELNQSRFPILSLLARDVLAVPISTVASESAFSTGGRVLDPFRSSLTPKIVEALICTQDWLRKSKRTKSLEETIEDVQKIEEGFADIGISDVGENTIET